MSQTFAKQRYLQAVVVAFAAYQRQHVVVTVVAAYRERIETLFK